MTARAPPGPAGGGLQRLHKPPSWLKGWAPREGGEGRGEGMVWYGIRRNGEGKDERRRRVGEGRGGGGKG